MMGGSRNRQDPNENACQEAHAAILYENLDVSSKKKKELISDFHICCAAQQSRQETGVTRHLNPLQRRVQLPVNTAVRVERHK